MVEGRLHSIETMGLVDGPGIRTVFFLQGCPLRCLYCHNPDSQNMFSNKQITPEEVLEIAKKYKTYYNRSGGGVTFSGGEALLQGKFLVETLKLLKEEGIHTVIDTSGVGDRKYYKEILEYGDMIILDVKHFDSEGYKNITGKAIGRFQEFLSYLDDFHGTIWMRHVMVPGITDNEESIYELFNKVSYLSDKIDRFEILPYHTMGVSKYEDLGIEYKLKGVPEMDKEKAMKFENILKEMLDKEKYKINKDVI